MVPKEKPGLLLDELKEYFANCKMRPDPPSNAEIAEAAKAIYPGTLYTLSFLVHFLKIVTAMVIIPRISWYPFFEYVQFLRIDVVPRRYLAFNDVPLALMNW